MGSAVMQVGGSMTGSPAIKVCKWQGHMHLYRCEGVGSSLRRVVCRAYMYYMRTYMPLHVVGCFQYLVTYVAYDCYWYHDHPPLTAVRKRQLLRLAAAAAAAECLTHDLLLLTSLTSSV